MSIPQALQPGVYSYISIRREEIRSFSLTRYQSNLSIPTFFPNFVKTFINIEKYETLQVFSIHIFSEHPLNQC